MQLHFGRARLYWQMSPGDLSRITRNLLRTFYKSHKITSIMKISELRQLVFKIESKYGPDVPVYLMEEDDVFMDGFNQSLYHGITDVRIVEDWPLPGESLIVQETEKPIHAVIFQRWVQDPAYIDSSLAKGND